MSAYDQMSPRQFAQTFDKIKEGGPVDPDELAQKRFDNPSYEPSEAEKGYLQGVEHGSQNEKEAEKAEKEERSARRRAAGTTVTNPDGTQTSTARPPAPRRVAAPKPPPDPARQALKAARSFGRMASKARGRRR